MSHNNEVVYRQMKPGDLIEIPRGNYSHYAVCVGGGDLVHLTGGNDGIDASNIFNLSLGASGRELNKARVCRNNFWEVVGNSAAKIDYRKDMRESPLSTDQIIRNALSRIGEEGYNLIWKNCEHFATWCRYGVEFSEQIETAITWAAMGTLIAAGIGIMFQVSKNRNKNKH